MFEDVFVLDEMHVILPYPILQLLAELKCGNRRRRPRLQRANHTIGTVERRRRTIGTVVTVLRLRTTFVKQHVRTVSLFETEVHELIGNTIVRLALKHTGQGECDTGTPMRRHVVVQSFHLQNIRRLSGSDRTVSLRRR